MTQQQFFKPGRRQFIGGAIATGVTLSTAHSTFAQATPATGTRNVTDQAGRTVQIPANPQRIVTLSLPILEIAISVGLIPVGTASFATIGGIPDYFGDAADQIELIGDTEFDFEKVVSLKPDLVVMDYFGEQDDESLAMFEQICPIVTTGPFRENWRADAALVAEFLNRSDEFDAVEARYDERVASISQGLDPEWTGKTVALLRFRAADMRILKSYSFAGTVISDLGLSFPEIVSTGDGIAEDFSLEQAKLIDVDALFVVRDSGDEADAAFAAGVTNPIMQSLAVFQADRVYTVDQVVWITLRGYGASEIILTDIENYLVKGLPAPELPA